MSIRAKQLRREMRDCDGFICLDETGADLLLCDGFLAVREPFADGLLNGFTHAELGRPPAIDDEFCASVNDGRPDLPVAYLRTIFDPSTPSIEVTRVRPRVAIDRDLDIVFFANDEHPDLILMGWKLLQLIWKPEREPEPVWRYRVKEHQLVAYREDTVVGVLMGLAFDIDLFDALIDVLVRARQAAEAREEVTA